MSIFHDIQMATHFGTGCCYSHMVGYAGSPTYTAYVDMTLTRSKVKVTVTGLLNFRQLAKPCMLAAMTAAPLRGFLVYLSLTVWCLVYLSNIFIAGNKIFVILHALFVKETTAIFT